MPDPTTRAGLLEHCHRPEAMADRAPAPCSTVTAQGFTTHPIADASREDEETRIEAEIWAGFMAHHVPPPDAVSEWLGSLAKGEGPRFG